MRFWGDKAAFISIANDSKENNVIVIIESTLVCKVC